MTQVSSAEHPAPGTASQQAPRVGVLGLGQMGSRMALRLLNAGHEVTGYDSSAAAMDRLEPHGLRRAETPSNLGSQADLVITSLPDGTAVLDMLSDPDGLLSNAAFTTYVEASTVGPPSAKQAATLLAAKGIGMLDGPVSGGIEGRPPAR